MNICMTVMKDWKANGRKANEQKLPMGVCCDRIMRKTGLKSLVYICRSVRIDLFVVLKHFERAIVALSHT